MPYVDGFNHDAVSSCVLMTKLKRGSMTSPCLCIRLSFFPCIYPLQRAPPRACPAADRLPVPLQTRFSCFSPVSRLVNPSRIN